MVPKVGQVDRDSNGGFGGLEQLEISVEQRDGLSHRHANPVNVATGDCSTVRKFRPPEGSIRKKNQSPLGTTVNLRVLHPYTTFTVTGAGAEIRNGGKRVKRIELSYEPWEGSVLPLNYTRAVR